MRELASVVAVLTVLLTAASAHAQSRDPAGAEKLYDDGMKLRKAGDWVQSCQRFDMSFQLDPAAGTQLQRATCAERDGKLALAWARYREARTLASDAKSEKQRQGIEAFADAALARLEPRLPYLTVTVSPAVEGLVLLRDGAPMPPGLDLPVDPGEHTIEASAPGFLPVRQTVTAIEAKHASLALTLQARPELPPATSPPAPPSNAKSPEPPPVAKSPEPPPVAKPPEQPPTANRSEPPPYASEGLSGIQWAGIALGGAGLASFIASGITGASAAREAASLDELCPPDASGSRQCGADDVSKATSFADNGQQLAIVSTATTFAGMALAGAGTLLFVLGGDEEPAASALLAPLVAPGFAGLTLGGTFQ